MKISKHPLFHGWVMVVGSSSIPVLFCVIMELALSGIDVADLSRGIVFRTIPDHSHLFIYCSYGLLHTLFCFGLTTYTYEIFKATSSPYMIPVFLKHLCLSFILVSTTFVLSIYLFDTPLEILSSDMLWVGLRLFEHSHLLFKPIELSSVFSIKPFDLAPIFLVIVAFLPASAIMLAIPHLVTKISVNDDEDVNDVISQFLNEFEALYYMMVGLLVSSGIATHLYLNTPFSTIDINQSESYRNVMNAVFSTWSMIFFLVLLGVLFYTYSLISKKVHEGASNNLILTQTQKYRYIRTEINFHFMIKRKSGLFASAFTPILLIALKQALS